MKTRQTKAGRVVRGVKEITPRLDLKQWAIHVFGPGLRHNPTAEPNAQVPIFAVHDPATDYREFVLVDHVTARVIFAYQPKIPISMGTGSNVVAAGYTHNPLTLVSFDSWNWTPDGPPRIRIEDGDTKEAVIRKVLRAYSKKHAGEIRVNVRSKG